MIGGLNLNFELARSIILVLSVYNYILLLL